MNLTLQFHVGAYLHDVAVGEDLVKRVVADAAEDEKRGSIAEINIIKNVLDKLTG